MADQPKANIRLKAWIARQLSIARILAHAFTGMLDHEIRVMSHDCFEKIEIPGIGLVPLIKSHTQKWRAVITHQSLYIGQHQMS
ncbi:hypothetical protein [Serratia sp. (in: enterobacteria)]|uniref:hypothetical protein n=1 Tax=Serratia sp. (in: enterobacteria) TaxID=616 RepID=UPI00398A455B